MAVYKGEMPPSNGMPQLHVQSRSSLVLCIPMTYPGHSKESPVPKTKLTTPSPGEFLKGEGYLVQQ